MNSSNPAKDEFANLLMQAMQKAGILIQLSEKDLIYSISFAKDQQFDISSSISLRLAKQARMSPSQLADIIVKNISEGKLVKQFSQLNGYINANLDEKAFTAVVLGTLLQQKEKYGASEIGNGKKVIIEFPGINPNKPWHIGHLRNALLGDAVSRIMTFCSFNVEREDYIDDLGLQMVEILWGVKNLGKTPDKKYDQFLGELYVEVNKRMAEPKVDEELKAMLKQMENVNSSEFKEVREIAENSVKAQYETSFNYGIYHDVLIRESDIVREGLLRHTLAILEEKKITKRPTEGKLAGCVVVEAGKSGDDELDDKVLVRSNGVATYTGKDVAFHMWKLGLLPSSFNYKTFLVQPNGKPAYISSDTGISMNYGSADMAINVIGSAQNAQQSVVREVLSIVSGGRTADKLIHLSYGEVSLSSGSLSGRSGGWIGESRNYTADDLLAQMQAKALQIVSESKRVAEGVNKEEIARKVSLSAIKFEYLKTEPIKKVTFDWERALNFDSNSGPYCMYTYARASRVLEKAGEGSMKLSQADMDNMTRGTDLKIIKKISECSEIVEKACTEYKPNLIADYALDLSLLFASFYESMPVLNSGNAMALRLGIVWAVRQTIFNMLGLLGIETAESM